MKKFLMLSTVFTCVMIAGIVFTACGKGKTEPTRYEVTFDMHLSTAPQVEPITRINFGDTISEPTAPAKSGYTFGGWYTTSEFTTPFDFETPITQDIILHAKWNIKVYGISYIGYNNENQNQVNPRGYTVNDTVTFTPFPRTGYNCVFSPSSIPAGSTGHKDITVTFVPIKYQIIYQNMFDGTTTNPTTYTIEDDDIILTAPTRAGYTGEWAEGDNAIIFAGSMHDKSFIAMWTAHEQRITLDIQGGERGEVEFSGVIERDGVTEVTALTGSTVTITITPNDGFTARVDVIANIEHDGGFHPEHVDVQTVGNTHTYVTPAGAVTISIIFDGAR
jgi:uncharacterized repeat protein (TIGR02543 family)